MLKGVSLAAALTAAVAVACVSVSAATTKPATSGSSYPVVQGIGPRFTTAGGATVLPTTRTVPHWHGSFVDGVNGHTYGFNMVGANPATGTATTVDTEVIPVNFQFSADGGYQFAGAQAASWAEQSPIFVPTALPSGENAQYLDAVMRSEFNKIGTTYHVTLTNTATLPTQTIVVPRQHGQVFQIPGGPVLGLVTYSWFSGDLQGILSSLHLDPTTLPIVISSDVYLYLKSLTTCCVIGFHGAAHVTGLGAGSVHGNGSQAVQTFAWASWIPSPTIFGPGLTDVAALSHEISEWGYDPFTDNFVNPWSVPGEPQYGCSNILETGDPLVGVDFTAGGTNPTSTTGPSWHLQDEAFLWWFERQPTQASNGAYSYLGTFTSFVDGRTRPRVRRRVEEGRAPSGRDRQVPGVALIAVGRWSRWTATQFMTRLVRN